MYRKRRRILISMIIIQFKGLIIKDRLKNRILYIVLNISSKVKLCVLLNDNKINKKYIKSI